MTEEAPVFAEPWEAHAFALAVRLSEAGFFTWTEWSQALAAELAEASRRGEPDDGSRYYHYWLATLERLIASKGLVMPASLLARKEEWAEAYRRIPHGEPVTLQRAKASPHPTPLPARGEREQLRE
jgi:nitrile hydratase accessory protein